jgi:hypothetical protein
MQKVSKNLVGIGWRISMSLHDTRSVSQCGASPDVLKMHSQLCCEVHLDLAESKSINVRAGQDRALVLLWQSKRFQQILFVTHTVAIACLSTLLFRGITCWRQGGAPHLCLALLPLLPPRRICSTSSTLMTGRMLTTSHHTHSFMLHPLSAPSPLSLRPAS